MISTLEAVADGDYHQGMGYFCGFMLLLIDPADVTKILHREDNPSLPRPFLRFSIKFFSLPLHAIDYAHLVQVSGRTVLTRPGTGRGSPRPLFATPWRTSGSSRRGTP